MLNPPLASTAARTFTRDDLRHLAEPTAHGDSWRLSLYLPLSAANQEVRQARILLKDLRAEAEREMDARGVPAGDKEDMLSPLDRLLEESDIIAPQGRGLAYLAAPGFSEFFMLPDPPPAMVEVDRHFRLDPLLPLLFEGYRFHLLTLSLNSVRLWEVDRLGLTEIPLGNTPTNMRDALRFEDTGSYLNYHTGAPSHGPGRRPAIYHGVGGGTGDVKEMKRDILTFFQIVNTGVVAQLPKTTPLLLAGVDFLLPIYAEANTYPLLLPERLKGNFEAMPAQELHAKALRKFRQAAARRRKQALALYTENLATGRTAAGLSDVVPLAHQGRVSHLFLRPGQRRRGRFHPATGEVVLDAIESPEDLVNLACTFALLGNAEVYLVEPGDLPGGADMAALVRF